jgi:hypothetical protein
MAAKIELDTEKFLLAMKGAFGLTRKEIEYLIPVIENGQLDAAVRIKIAEEKGVSVKQVNTYMARLIRKKMILGRKLHPALIKGYSILLIHK